MREYTKNSENVSRTQDSRPKASRQASMSEILQAYKSGPSRTNPVRPENIEELELLPAANVPVQHPMPIAPLQLQGEGEEEGSDNEIYDSEEKDEDDEITEFLEKYVQAPVAAPIVDNFKKAQGDNISKVKDLTDAQKEYQNWLLSNISSEKIMDIHRSVGFEYEFATYSILNKGLEIDSHKEIGRSKQLSTLFSTPFKLETDSDNEIEIVTPPLLIADIGGYIDKYAANNIYLSYKEAAKNLREKNIGKKIRDINLVDEGFGNVWKFSTDASDLEISAERDKHTDSKDEIYSQMNISLTPGEISDFMSKQSKKYAEDPKAETLEGTELFSNAYFGIFNLLNGKIQESLDRYFEEFVSDSNEVAISEKEMVFSGVEEKVQSSIILISRALSNILALPSIIYNQEYRDRSLYDSQHSAVKETFGIWVKDTIQSVLYGFVSDDEETKKILLSAIKATKNKIFEVLYRELLDSESNAFPKADPMDDKKEELESEIDRRISEFDIRVNNEAKSSIKLILDMLESGEPDFDYKTKFLHESFEDENAGYGVRKDTFINIKSGSERKLHLAEIRGDDTIEEYLGTKEIDTSTDDLIIWEKDKKAAE